MLYPFISHLMATQVNRVITLYPPRVALPLVARISYKSARVFLNVYKFTVHHEWRLVQHPVHCLGIVVLHLAKSLVSLS